MGGYPMIHLLLLLSLCPCPVKRDAHGHIVRSSTERYAFEKATGYPHGRAGYVIDHVIPLCACGADRRENMQWQRADSAKAKDKLEIEACDRMGK
jgi:hypothetical protein